MKNINELLKDKKIRLIVTIIVALFALGIIKNILIQSAVSIGAKAVTGAKVSIGYFNLGILTQKIHIKKFKLYNPKGFPKEVMLDIPEIRVDCKVGALLGGKIHLPLAIFNLKEVVLIKNKDGVYNVDALKSSLEQEKSAEKEPAKEQKPAPEMAMQIDELRLNIGEVVVKDYTKGEEPEIKVYDVNLDNKVYKNITSAQQLVTIVLVEAMKPAALSGAKMYAASALFGPMGLAAGVLAGKDSGVQEFKASVDKVFKTSLAVLQEMGGEIKSQDPAKGEIKAKVSGSDITIQIQKVAGGKTAIDVAARKMMLPKPEIANGVLRQIAEKL